MVEIKVELKKLVERLRSLEKQLVDMTPIFKDIADIELSETKLRYIEEVDPDHRKWAKPFTLRRGGPGQVNTAYDNPWAYVVASNYQAAPPGFHFFDSGSGDKILRDTSTMFNSIGRAYGKDFAAVGTNLEYAKKHQYGEGVKKREFLGINKKTIENIDQIINRRLGLSK